MAIYVCLCVCVFCQDPKPNGLETSVIAKIVKVRNYQIRFKPFLRKNYLKLSKQIILFSLLFVKKNHVQFPLDFYGEELLF